MPNPIHPGFQCPYCKTTADPTHKGEVSAKGWLAFIGLLLMCFPLAWLGLMMREDVVKCSQCRMRLS